MDLDHFADDSNQMDLSQDEQKRGKDSKGKEIAGISRRRTWPQLNFLAILADYKLTLDASSRKELCQKLYDGVYLKPNRLEIEIKHGWRGCDF
ncbi:hypothetical protein Vadar_017921 [Vaccinium darrowii]|uniref:Uncharacterized protein n=1 Tax=Vaccinium darrowii TaxID=229202 RepID=A0ACB7Z554_9ERIC|nr:hypothetical protein Vadar_017921 [Vaccinium darrowii]